jgi:hypothetical protein
MFVQASISINTLTNACYLLGNSRGTQSGAALVFHPNAQSFAWDIWNGKTLICNGISGNNAYTNNTPTLFSCRYHYLDSSGHDMTTYVNNSLAIQANTKSAPSTVNPASAMVLNFGNDTFQTIAQVQRFLVYKGALSLEDMLVVGGRLMTT